MSKTIDERVVSMQFDNKDFEKNVRTSLSTIEKLKQSLNLKGASKGLEHINDVAKKCDMSTMAKGVETVKTKFTALEVVGVTALANITNSAVNAGKRIAKSLTIDPTHTGFKEYELKMDSVKTIMASTGESVETVNKYLEELNEYSDQTIYSFSDMTQNIGKFTNAGVKLEDAVLAIKGISNEAAISGANANEASRAMYNFAQALSAGYVKLIDWKSIENANMATMEFKQQLIDTAVSVGTLTKTSDGMYQTLNGKTLTATQNFNESLQEQWMTTDVLVSTLRDYADANTEIGKKAFAAAQDVTKLTQMFDVLKETAQSGWARTWEIIFGNINQAKAFFTPLTNFFSGIIQKASDARNTLLEGALGSPLGGLAKKIEGVTKTTTNAIETVKDYGDVVAKVLNGDYGSGESRFDKLTKEGYDWAKIQNLVNEELGSTIRHEEKLSDTTKETTKAIKKLTDAQLKQKGFTEDEIKVFRDLEKQAEDTKTPIEDLIKTLDKPSGRTLLIESFNNALESLTNVIGAVKKSWAEVFPKMESDQLYGMIESIHKFTEYLKPTTTTLEKITDTFKGLFSILKVFTTVIKSVISIGVKLLGVVLKPTLNLLLNLTSTVGRFVSSFTSGLLKIGDILGEVGGSIKERLTEWSEKFKETKLFEVASEYFEKGSKKITDALDNIQSHFDNFSIKVVTDKIFNSIDFFGNMIEKIGNNKYVVAIFDTITNSISNFVEGIKSLDFKMPKLPEFNIDGFSKFARYLEENSFTGISGGFIGGLKYFQQQISFKFDDFTNNALVKMSEFYLKHGDTIKSGIDKCKEVVLKLTEFVFGVKNVNLPDILDVANKFLAFVTLFKVLGIVNNFTGMFDSIGDAFEKFAKAQKWKAVSQAFKSMAIAFGAFTACLVVINNMGCEEAMDSSKVLLSLLVTMGAVVGGVLALSGRVKGGLNMAAAVSSVMMISVALAILVKTLKVIDGTQFRNLDKSFAIMAGTLLTMSMSVAMIGRYCGGATFKSAAAIITMLTALKMVLGILEDYANFNWNKVSRAIPKMIAMLTGLALVLRIATGGIKATAIGDGASASANVSGMAMLMLSITVSLKILMKTIEELGSMDQGAMKQGISGLLAVMGGISVMLGIISLTNKGTVLKKGDKSVNNFTGLARALLAVSATILLLGNMDTGKLLKGGAAVSAILGLFTLMIRAMGSSKFNFKNVLTTFVGMGLIIAELGFITNQLSSNDWQSTVGSAAALSTLLITMSGVLIALSKMTKGSGLVSTSKMVARLGGLTLILTGLAGILIVMKNVNGQNAIGQVTALSELLLAMSACLIVLNKTTIGKFSPKAWLLSLAGIGLIVGELAIIFTKMQDVNGQNTIGQATALGELLLAMSGVLVICSKVGLKAELAIPALVVLGKAIGALAIFITILGAFAKLLDSDGSVIETGVKVMGSLGQAIGDFIGNIAGGILGGIANGITGSLAQLGTDLSNFMTNGKVFFDGLKDIDSSMVGNAGILTGVILALEVLGAANGIANLFTIGKSLPNLGRDLGNFVIQANPFFEGIKNIDESVSKGAELLSKAILTLTKAEFISGIGNLLGIGSFSDFGTKMSSFGDSLVQYSNSVSSLTDKDITQIETSAKAGMALTNLSSVLSRTGGLLQALIGVKDLGDFGNKISSFGKSLVSYSNSVSSLSEDDITQIETSAKAGMAMADLGSVVSRTGGLLQEIVGEKDLSDFGVKMEAFGGSLVKYSNSITSLTDDDATKIQMSADAGTAMANMEDCVIRTGGWISKIVGEKDLADFGNKMVTFGDSIMTYADKVSSIDDSDIEAINKSKNAIEAMTEAAKKVPTTGDILDGITGTKDPGSFGRGMKSLAIGLKEYSTTASQITDDDITAIKNTKKAVKEMADVADKVPTSGSSLEIFYGQKDMSGFGKGMASLAEGVMTCVYKARVINEDDINSIDNLKKAIEKISNAAKSIPNSGGLVSMISGDNTNMSGFVDGVAKLSRGIMKCLSYARNITEEDIVYIDNLKKAIEKISNAAKSIPNSGGLVSMISGDNTDMSGFATGISKLVNSIVSIIIKARSITEEDIESIDYLKKIIEKISRATSSIFNFSGMSSVSSGDSGAFSTIGSTLSGLIDHIVSIVTKARTITEDDIESIDNLKRITLSITKIIPSISRETTDISSVVTNMNSLVTLINSMGNINTDGVSIFAKAMSDLGNVSIDGFVNSFSSAIPKANAAIISFIANISSSVRTNSNIMTKEMSSLGQKICSEFTKSISSSNSKITNASVILINSFIRGIKERNSAVISTFNLLLSNAIKLIISKDGKFKDAGVKLIGGLVSGIDFSKGKVEKSMMSVVSGALSGVNKKYDSFVSAGKYLGSGLVSGIEAKYKAAYNAGLELGRQAVQGELDGQHSNSPSKDGIKAGKWLGEGLVIGLDKIGSKVYNAGHNIGDIASKSMTSVVSKLSDMINTDVDVQPTIRPVVDLSEVSSGVGAINNLLDIKSNIGVMAKLDRISGSMSIRNQNGSNNDIISAIDGLRKDLGNIRGNTYNVNGVTYDDGSNISNAVEALIRAARIERRV